MPSNTSELQGSVVWNPQQLPQNWPGAVPAGAAGNAGYIPITYPLPLPPPAWPDNTLIQEILVRMDKELAEALKLLLKRLDKIDEVVGRIEQSGRYSS